MPDYGHELAFGTFLTPQSQRPADVVALAQLTERVGFDLVSFQDHPYLLPPAFPPGSGKAGGTGTPLPPGPPVSSTDGPGTIRQVTDRAVVSRWLARYEAVWRTPGTVGLAGLFTGDATYLKSPYEQPVAGLGAIKRMWEEEREGPDEVFTLATDILAVDGLTAVVRAEVHYGDPPVQEYRDLWVIRFTDDGRCAWFEEWPFWPGRPYVSP